MNVLESKSVLELETQEIQISTRSHHEPQRYGFLVTSDNDMMIIDDDEPTSYQQVHGEFRF